MIHKFRKFLIHLGKILPFILCALILTCYCESFLALFSKDYVIYDNSLILNTPLSFFLAQKVQYDILILFIALVISIATETCFWNKLACVYLGFNLFEKSIFDFEIEPTYIYAICIANIIISLFLTFKGIKALMKR